MVTTPRHWLKRIQEGAKPAYILIAEVIAEDIHKGSLAVRDPLPTLRDLARDLGLAAAEDHRMPGLHGR